MRRGFNQDRQLDDCHYIDPDNRHRVITYIYYQGRIIWELIIGFLFSKDEYSLQSKDGYILKAKDQ